MTKHTLAAAALLAAACGGPPRLPSSPRGTPALELRGAFQGAPVVLGEADLAALPRAAASGRDPVSGRAARWEGASLAAILKRARPPKRATPDTVVVHTRAGAAVPVPLTFVRQLKPVLADRADGEGTARLLAWPNLDQRGLDADPRAAAWWARDVVALEIVAWPRTYGPALAPPVGASAPARVGAGLFASRCVACHRLRGAGGTVGPELTSAATRLDAERYAAALAGHDFEGRGQPRPDDEARGQLWAFLQAIARAPEPEPLPPAREEERREVDPEPPGRGY